MNGKSHRPVLASSPALQFATSKEYEETKEVATQKAQPKCKLCERFECRQSSSLRKQL